MGEAGDHSPVRVMRTEKNKFMEMKQKERRTNRIIQCNSFFISVLHE
jgi:hypothetical protein